MNNVEKIVKILYEEYPNAECSLNFNNPLELLISVMLSAQSTDAQINKLTPALFERFKTAKDYATCDITELEEYVKSSGFYKNKAKNIKNSCKIIDEKYNGKVPETMEELVELPGVGRKTANVVMLNAFNKCEGIAIDTHAKRISKRIGLSNSDDPLKIILDEKHEETSYHNYYERMVFVGNYYYLLSSESVKVYQLNNKLDLVGNLSF